MGVPPNLGFSIINHPFLGTQRAWRGAVERGRGDGGLPRAGCAAGGWPGADLWGRRVGRRCWDFNRFPMGMGFKPMIFMVFP